MTDAGAAVHEAKHWPGDAPGPVSLRTSEGLARKRALTREPDDEGDGVDAASGVAHPGRDTHPAVP